MRPVEVIEWIRKRDPQAMKSIGCSDDKLTEPPGTLVTHEEPPVTLVTCDEPPETLVTCDEPPGRLVTCDEPPETLVTCDEPPGTLVTSDEPPETLVTCDEPPETLVTSDEPPATLVTCDEPPETLVTSDEPPGTLVTHEEPPETLVTGDEPPETLVNCEDPPETLVTHEEPPKTLMNRYEPPWEQRRKMSEQETATEVEKQDDLFSVYVGNLHNEVVKEDLLKLFSDCGSIKNLVILSKRENENYSFVRFGSQDGAIKAIKEINGWPLKGKRIIVRCAKESLSKLQLCPPKDVPHLEGAPDKSVISNSILNLTLVKEEARRVDSEFLASDCKSNIMAELELIKEATRLPPPVINISTEAFGFKTVYKELVKLEQELGISGFSESAEKSYLAVKQLFSKDLEKIPTDDNH
ncbi:hypothetical protein Btru_026382 [Bulinus truncatus]|nr:hypothetical protein Btru_026382 [Bulinus truncatus]